ncbi:MAG: adenylate kinase family protein [Nitrososphaerales archaeon]
MLIITGNPGVGKHTVAKIVAKKLDLKLIDINAVAIKKHAIIRKDKIGYVVDLKKLSSLLRKELTRKCLAVGHLAPYVLKKRDAKLVVVLRRSPYELEKVYSKRGYSNQKAANNISSEIIGVCLYDAIKRFGRNKVAEVDSTAKKAENVANQIISIVNGKSKRSVGKVDWLSLIVKNDDLQRFFMYD